MEERYADPMPMLMEDFEVLSGKVEGHLKQMGLEWNLNG